MGAREQYDRRPARRRRETVSTVFGGKSARVVEARICECRACGGVLTGGRLQDTLWKIIALARRAKKRKRVGFTHEIFDRSLEDALLDSGKHDLELFRIAV